MKSLLLGSIFVLLLCLIAPVQIFACQCAGKPTVLEEFNFSKVVVAGRIDSVHRVRANKRERDLEAFRSVTLIVDKVYKGDVRIGDKVVLAQGGGADCAFEWDEKQIGQKYLFYLGEPTIRSGWNEETGEMIPDKEPSYRTSFCGRSTDLDDADEDIAYLNNLEKLKGKTRVSGELSFSSDDERSVEGIEVRIKGKDSQFKTKYLRAGFFEIYDVPPGEYIVEVMAPRGWKVGEHWRYTVDYSMPDYREGLGRNERRIRIDKGGHVGLGLALIPDTNVSGRVLSPAGKPMANVWVSALGQDTNDDREKYQARTDEKGVFTFETMDPGTYYLVVNNGGRINDEHSFGRTFYPGVSQRNDAGVIVVEPGRYNAGLDIQIPQINRLIEISGKIEFADGHPVGEEWIIFRPESKEKFDSIETRSDAQGRFTLRIPFDAAGHLTGRRYFGKDDYACAQIVAAREVAKSDELKTVPISITGIEPLTNAVLKFPFDFCEKDDKK